MSLPFVTRVMIVLASNCLIALPTQAKLAVALHHRAFDADCHHTIRPYAGYCWLGAPGLFYARLLQDLPLTDATWPDMPPTPPAYRPITAPQSPILIPLPPAPITPEPAPKPVAPSPVPPEPAPPEPMPPEPMPPELVPPEQVLAEPAPSSPIEPKPVSLTPEPATPSPVPPEPVSAEPVPPSPIEPKPISLITETQATHPPTQPQTNPSSATSRASVWITKNGYSELMVVTPESATELPDPTSIITPSTATHESHVMSIEWPDLALHLPEMGQLTQSRSLMVICDCDDSFIHFTGDATFTFDLETWEGTLDDIVLYSDGGQSATGKLTFWAEESFPALFSDRQAQLSLVINQLATEWGADLIFGMYLPKSTQPDDTSLAARGLFSASEYERLWGLSGYFDAECAAPELPCGTEN